MVDERQVVAAGETHLEGVEAIVCDIDLVTGEREVSAQ